MLPLNRFHHPHPGLGQAVSIAILALISRPYVFGAELSPKAATASKECSGPLGALIPECQNSKTSPEAATRRIPAGGSCARTLTVPSWQSAAGPAVTQEPPPAPAPQAPTEFQRFAASSTGE